MSDVVREHISATIRYLSAKRALMIVELDQIDQVLKALVREEEALPRTQRIVFPSAEPAQGEYSGISVRWAVLFYLAEHAPGPQQLGAIADALRAGGSRTAAQSFNSNVSAVLSQMVAKGEVAKLGEGFVITGNGRAVFQNIRHSEKFLNRDKAERVEEE